MSSLPSAVGSYAYSTSLLAGTRGLIKNFGQRGGGGGPIGRRALNRGGSLLRFASAEVTGPRRLNSGLVVPGKFTVSTKSATKGQKLKGQIMT